MLDYFKAAVQKKTKTNKKNNTALGIIERSKTILIKQCLFKTMFIYFKKICTQLSTLRETMLRNMVQSQQ